ncbi:lysozyme [Achromobacter sp. 2789STDY5608633]|uniref:lysozyme n=1 Tax=Achromobacter sp. 2789STDY5608633 TaxID=1806501 RepID=UPI0006C89870|nr:lysozyme [Achromobacter sp. 2789STDY5608633]
MSSKSSLNQERKLRTGAAGLSLIKHYEGCRLEAYQDIVGIWTIGYGDTENVQPGLVITQEEAEERLRNRLERDFEPSLRQSLTLVATQCQFDAIACLAYNIGAAAFASSTLVRLFNAGDVQLAADQFLRWDKAGGKSIKGLRRRRAAERALFLGASVTSAISTGEKTP